MVSRPKTHALFASRYEVKHRAGQQQHVVAGMHALTAAVSPVSRRGKPAVAARRGDHSNTAACFAKNEFSRLRWRVITSRLRATMAAPARSATTPSASLTADPQIVVNSSCILPCGDAAPVRGSSASRTCAVRDVSRGARSALQSLEARCNAQRRRTRPQESLQVGHIDAQRADRAADGQPRRNVAASASAVQALVPWRHHDAVLAQRQQRVCTQVRTSSARTPA